MWSEENSAILSRGNLYYIIIIFLIEKVDSQILVEYLYFLIYLHVILRIQGQVSEECILRDITYCLVPKLISYMVNKPLFYRVTWNVLTNVWLSRNIFLLEC